jgi:integrase
MRVCTAEEATQLLAALEPDDQVAHALAFYAGLRRAEIHRLEWHEVDLDGFRSGCTCTRRSRRRAAAGARRSHRRYGRSCAPRGCAKASRRTAPSAPRRS